MDAVFLISASSVILRPAKSKAKTVASWVSDPDQPIGEPNAFSGGSCRERAHARERNERAGIATGP